MNSKILSQPISFVTKQPYEDQAYAKSVAIIDVIQQMANSEDELAMKLPSAEKAIYFAEQLSCQCNISGVTTFFDMEIAPYFHSIIEALRQLEAPPMIQVLEEIRKVVMGDHEITEDSIHEHAYETYPPFEDDSPWEADLERIESREADDDFHRRHKEFSAAYFDLQGYSFEPDAKPTA